jgi:oxygen-dependent protoporphyrinogen oxidase
MTTTATTLPSPLCIRFWHGASVSSSPDASAAADAPLLRTPPRNIAVLGGGITGLATAYFLRRELPDDSKITLYEASDRFGGWIETTKVPAAGHEGGAMIHFERGPRMIKSLNSSTVRFDDLALFDIVRTHKKARSGVSR